MDNLSDILSRLKDGRNTRLDWLPHDAPVSAIAETMVALANNAGGAIILGIQDAENISGVSDPDEATDRLIQAALATSPPLIIPIPRSRTVGDVEVVVALIPAGLPAVYSHEGRYLRRHETKNLPLSPRDLRHLMMERGEINYEMEIASGASLEDIDWQKAGDYVKHLRGADDMQTALYKRGCLTREMGNLRPTNAGILLFGKEPQQFVRGSEIAAVRFAGLAMSDKFNRQDITGTLIDQIKRAETFLIDHLRKEVALSDSMARQEQYEYPLEAARELVVNAVAHRDYSVSGDSIRLFLFSDRMEVYSPGGLPGPITVDNIKDERFSRNPIIVQVLADLHFIERLGYGVDRVIELMRQQNMQEPEFEERAGGFRVTLRSNRAYEDHSDTTSTKAQAAVRFDGTYQGEAINPRQEAALMFLHKTPNTRITNSDLKQMFPDVHPETIRRDLVDLVNKKVLMKMGQKRGSYYVLRRTEDSTSEQEEKVSDTKTQD